MQSVLIEIPGEIVSQTRLPPKRAKQMITEELIIRLYQQGIITSAQGTRLLSMNRLRSERFLAEDENPNPQQSRRIGDRYEAHRSWLQSASVFSLGTDSEGLRAFTIRADLITDIESRT